MEYLFLTGGTGLLGEYLVRDFLRAGKDLALLVRSTRKEPAHVRVERLISRWEEVDGQVLPRPVVLEGDLGEDNLGLDEHAMRWVARNCSSAMHNAASLTFHAAGPNDEPWRSNLHGTRRVLDLCRRSGIREYHHVSTAYVCGLRTGRVLEPDLDVGQTHGNDYEISKYQSELMVRGADFLDSPTIYRPGIILGDSESGYTSTFYGFYVPLKLLSSLLTKAAGIASNARELADVIEYGVQRLPEVVNLTGRERKNYVPVDWVASVMSHIALRPEHHGKTYHLTPTEPVSLRLTTDVMGHAFHLYTELAEKKTHNAPEWSDFEKFFAEGMKVYESYWRDDPVFDTTNTSTAVPHLPCPVLDADLFLRMCKFAIETNFGRRGPRPPAKPKIDVREKLQRLIAPASAESEDAKAAYVGLRVDGSGGGQWELGLANGRLISVDQGITDRCTATFHLDSRTFASLATEETTAEEALADGRIDLTGNDVPLDQLAQMLQEAAVGVP